MRRSARLRPRFAALAGVVLGAAVLAACGGGGGDSSAVRSGSGSDTASTAGQGTAATVPTGSANGSPNGGAGSCSLSDSGTTARTAPASTSTSLLTAVQAAVHDGCDRIVFAFRDGAPPGYDVQYKPGPFTRGESQEPLDVQGAAYLVVRLDKASGLDSSSPMSTASYTGPRVLTGLGLTHAAEVVNAEDFEGVMTWVVGLDSQRPFTVTTLNSPPRVVVDVS
jgi:hypothetical protein